MTKRLHVLALAIAAVLAISATSLAATSGVLALGSSPRSTVTPPPTKRVRQPQGAKVKALQSALAAAKAKVKALEKSLKNAKTSTQKRVRAKALAAAKAKVKALEKALAKAKQSQCGTGYKLVKGKCVRA